jgi:hypothetical protein
VTEREMCRGRGGGGGRRGDDGLLSQDVVPLASSDLGSVEDKSVSIRGPLRGSHRLSAPSTLRGITSDLAQKMQSGRPGRTGTTIM